MSNDSKSTTFKVYMYEQEKCYLEWLVLQRENIETGGDIFGLWESKTTAVVQLILGPGKYCSRTTTSFYQDINYLSKAGEELTLSRGLCNIGEWHSHHRLGLPSPSNGDQNTVWKHIESVPGSRFLVFIAAITGSQRHVHIGCFMFCTETRTMSEGSMVLLSEGSPIREQFKDVSLGTGPEKGAGWKSYKDFALAKGRKTLTEDRDSSAKKTSTEKESRPSVAHRREQRCTKIKYKDTTDKTKLIAKQTTKYGTTEPNALSKTRATTKPSKKKRKNNSEYSSSTTEQEDQFNQPLRDLASPLPSSSSIKSNTRKSSCSWLCCIPC